MRKNEEQEIMTLLIGGGRWGLDLPRGFESEEARWRERGRGREIENRERETDTNWRETSCISFHAPWGGFIYVQEVTITNQER